MSARISLALVVTGAVALLAIVGILVAATSDRAVSSAPAFQGSLRPEGIPPSDFTLRDQDGRMVHLDDFRGRPVVVTFLYTTCEDTCPLTAQQIRGALDELGHDVPVVAVSVDPANDTARAARSFLRRQHMDGRMRYLVGDRRSLQRVWRAYGIQPQSDRYEHSASTVLLDARGRQVVGFFPQILTPETLAHDIRLLEARS